MSSHGPTASQHRACCLHRIQDKLLLINIAASGNVAVFDTHATPSSIIIGLTSRLSLEKRRLEVLMVLNVVLLRRRIHHVRRVIGLLAERWTRQKTQILNENNDNQCKT